MMRANHMLADVAMVLVPVLLIILGVIVKFAATRIIKSMDSLKDALADLRLDISVRYVTRVDFDRMIEALGDKAREYETKFCNMNDRIIIVEQRIKYCQKEVA
jgi:hypothetical protein